MRAVTKRLTLESRGFRYKVALHLSYFRIKFGDEIERESLRISSKFPISLRPKFKIILKTRTQRNEKWRCMCYVVTMYLQSESPFRLRLSHTAVGLYTETVKAQTTL